MGPKSLAEICTVTFTALLGDRLVCKPVPLLPQSIARFTARVLLLLIGPQPLASNRADTTRAEIVLVVFIFIAPSARSMYDQVDGPARRRAGVRRGTARGNGVAARVKLGDRLGLQQLRPIDDVGRRLLASSRRRRALLQRHRRA